MASLDVDPFFTDVPLDETTEICIYELFKSGMIICGLSGKKIFEMLS